MGSDFFKKISKKLLQINAYLDVFGCLSCQSQEQENRINSKRQSLPCNLVKADRDFVASINLRNQLGRVYSEVTPGR